MNPNVCSNAKSAPLELLKWNDKVLKYKALGGSPLDLLITFRAMNSIFNTVFENADAQLNLRWNNMCNHLGLPQQVKPEAFEHILESAESELGALALHGG